jgi:hypothetical protein
VIGGVPPSWRRERETCPVSTEGGTRRVQLVREGGGGRACETTSQTPTRSPARAPGVPSAESKASRCGGGSPPAAATAAAPSPPPAITMYASARSSTCARSFVRQSFVRQSVAARAACGRDARPAGSPWRPLGRRHQRCWSYSRCSATRRPRFAHRSASVRRSPAPEEAARQPPPPTLTACPLSSSRPHPRPGPARAPCSPQGSARSHRRPRPRRLAPAPPPPPPRCPTKSRRKSVPGGAGSAPSPARRWPRASRSLRTKGAVSRQ